MRAAALALLALLLAAADLDDARRLVEAGDLAGAEQAYLELLTESPNDPTLLYNLGTVRVLRGAFEEARAPLEAATRTARDSVRQRAYYNLGNADLEPAHRGEGDRAARLSRAIVAYKRALLLDPADHDAKWNLELARRLLREPEPPPPSPQDPDQPDQGGGGGGAGGGGGGAPQQGQDDPQPQSGAAGGPQPEMTREAAEQLLQDAEERELGLQREKLRKPQSPNPVTH